MLHFYLTLLSHSYRECYCKNIASASNDETIKFWDAKTGELLRTLRAPRPYEGMNITGAEGLTKV